MMLAFDPMSLALFAGAMEHTALRCRTVPRARVWMRRHSAAVLSAVVQEAADPIIDALNSADPRLLAIVALLLLVRWLVHAKITGRMGPIVGGGIVLDVI